MNNGLVMIIDLSQEYQMSIFDKFIKKINKFAELKKGWDSYDARPPSKLAVEKAIEFLKLLPNEPRKISPSVVGGIAFRFDMDYVEIENDGRVFVVFNIGKDYSYIRESKDLPKLARYVCGYYD